MGVQVHTGRIFAGLAEEGTECDPLRCKIPDNCMKVNEIWGREIHLTNTANGKPVLEITGRVGVTSEYLGT